LNVARSENRVFLNLVFARVFTQSGPKADSQTGEANVCFGRRGDLGKAKVNVRLRHERHFYLEQVCNMSIR
jgi:hypothetical protein